MTPNLVRAVALIGALVVIQTASSPAPSHAQANSIKASNEVALSTAEQEMLTEINRLRENPSEYVSYLENLKPLFKGKAYTAKGQPTLMTNEGWDAVEDAIRYLRDVKPQVPLTISRGLCLAALAHVKDQSQSGATGHRGANNDMIEDRLKPYGIWQGGVGENLSYGNEAARERVLTWLIDDGVASRGHRNKLLSSDYKVAGLSCGAHPEYGTMCVITLAGGFVDLKAQPTASTETKTPTQTEKPKSKKIARRL